MVFVIISPQDYVYLVYKYVEQSSSSSFCRNLLEKEDYVDQIEVNGHWPETVMAAIVLVRFLGRSERTYETIFMQVRSNYNFGIKWIQLLNGIYKNKVILKYIQI